MEIVTHSPTDGVYAATSDYVHALEVRGPERLLFVAGTLGLDLEGVPGTSLAEQLELIWSNIRAILAAADMTVDNIVRLTSYLRDASHAEANAAARVAALGGRLVPTTAIVAQTLAGEWLVEIESTLRLETLALSGGVPPDRRRDQGSVGWLSCSLPSSLVTCNVDAWSSMKLLPFVSEWLRIGNGCVDKGSGRCRSGCPTCGPRGSPLRRIVSLRWRPPAHMRPRIRPSSTPSRGSLTRATTRLKSEAGRALDGRRR